MISPKIEAMAGEMSNVVFLKVDVDEAEDVAQEYNISAMPTFIFLKNGQKVKDLKRKYLLREWEIFGTTVFSKIQGIRFWYSHLGEF